MVDNLAEKVDECPLNWGCRVLLAYNWDRKNCPLYGVVGCLLFRGYLSIEVNGRAIGTFRYVRYIVGVRYSGVSVKWGSTVCRKLGECCVVHSNGFISIGTGHDKTPS